MQYYKLDFQLPLFCLYIFSLTLIISYFAIPVLKRIAVRYNILDHPDSRKTHKTPTPLLGGVAIWGSFTFVIVIHLIIVVVSKSVILESDMFSPRLKFYASNANYIVKEISTVLVCGSFIMGLGLIDDVKNISITKRLIFETIVANIIVYMGFQPEMFFLPYAVAWFVTVVWIVGIINAFNLLDGANGLAGGVGMIAASLLSAVMFSGNQPLLGILLIALVAGILGFYRFNFPKASIFMGSAGSMFIGYILSIITVLATFMINEVSSHFALLIPIAILGVPIYDTFSVIIIRLFKRESIVRGDKNHLIHRLTRNGLKVNTGVLYIYLFAFCSGGSAIFLLNASLKTSIIVLVVILLIYTLLFLFERFMVSPKSYK